MAYWTESQLVAMLGDTVPEGTSVVEIQDISDTYADSKLPNGSLDELKLLSLLVAIEFIKDGNADGGKYVKNLLKPEIVAIYEGGGFYVSV